MRLISVNVGQPREVLWDGKVVATGIFKQPVEGRIMLRRLNLDGDRQADRKVHGGVNQAVYAYPHEHYDYWRGELPDRELPCGMFGENLTVTGLHEEAVHVGDLFRIGSALLRVTKPRFPCFKLAIKFGRTDIVKRFLDSGRTGFYLAVVQEGDVGAGDAIERVEQGGGISIAEAVRCFKRSHP